MPEKPNNSTRKLEIGFITKPDGSRWVYADLLKFGSPGKRPRLIPAFHDLYRIIRAMAICEDEKYPPPFAGRGRLASFLREAVYAETFNQLAVKYKIPERDGDEIVNTNGANVGSPGTSAPTPAPTPTVKPKLLGESVLTDKDYKW